MYQGLGAIPFSLPGTGKFAKWSARFAGLAADAKRVSRSAGGFDLAPHFKDGLAEEVKLTENLPVKRIWGGGSPERSGFWTPIDTQDIDALDLPGSNLRTNLTEGIIPAETTVYMGKTKYGEAEQIFIDNPEDVIIGERRTLK